MTSSFDLFLFSTEPQFIRPAVAAGVAGIIVDWEQRGKDERQEGARTQINRNTVEDLRTVRASTDARVICRINRPGEWTADEIEQALEAGTDEILLPMVRTVQEVKTVLDLVDERCGLGIMIETREAMASLDELARLPLARAYAGLNDLAIETRSANIFTLVADGAMARIREAFAGPFGFGGLTLPEGGSPIPCRLVMGELARLDCAFSVLRRSFHADIVGRCPSVAVPRIRAAMFAAFRRPPDVVRQEHEEFRAAVGAWKPRGLNSCASKCPSGRSIRLGWIRVVRDATRWWGR